MDITEHQRHELHKDLEQAICSQSASTLMSYLPPVGWADVATKRDLDHLGSHPHRHDRSIRLPCFISRKRWRGSVGDSANSPWCK